MLIDSISGRVDSIKNNLKLSVIYDYALYSDSFTGLTVLLLNNSKYVKKNTKIEGKRYGQNNPVNTVKAVRLNFVPKMTLLLTALDSMQYCQNQCNTVSEVLD